MTGAVMFKRKQSPAVIRVERLPRRWWQRQRVQLVCSCRWRSEQTWLERPLAELAFSDSMTMRAFAEIHFNRAHRSTDQWVTAPDGEEFLAGACQGHSACPVDRHEHGCFADDGTNCDHPEDHEPTEQGQRS